MSVTFVNSDYEISFEEPPGEGAAYKSVSERISVGGELVLSRARGGSG